MTLYDQETSDAFLPPPRELMQQAPLDSWVAVSADLKRIVATGKDLAAVVAHAASLGEHDVILERTPRFRGDHAF
jgi:hypothetical protein